MSYRLITLLAAIIAGLAGYTVGGPLGAFTGFVSIFATLTYVGPQRAIQRGWWQTDIMHNIGTRIPGYATNPVINWLVIHITGRHPAYTGETIRLDR